MSDDNNERIHHGQYGMRQRDHTLVSDRDAREQQKREAPLLKEMSIQIIPVTVNHLKAFANLPTMAGQLRPLRQTDNITGHIRPHTSHKL